jgi:hypothetical protein
MFRVAAILAGIFVAAYAAVHLGYARLEKELLGRSCCSIAQLPADLPISATGDQGKKEKLNRSIPGIPAAGGPPAPRPSMPATGQATDRNKPDFQVIIRRDIFQLVPEEEPIITKQPPAADQIKTPEAVPTTLNLTLLGTVLGDERTSRAIIIEQKQNEQKLYQIGDAVQGAVIESIERGQVILDVFGKRETLTMKKREGGGPGPPSLPARFSRPEPQPPPDLTEENVDEPKEDEAVQEKQVNTARRPPRIRPHRRINFRGNPLRNAPPDMGGEGDDIIEETEPPAPEEELPPLD